MNNDKDFQWQRIIRSSSGAETILLVLKLFQQLVKITGVVGRLDENSNLMAIEAEVSDNDGDLHILRITFDRAGDIACYFDGELITTK